MEADFASVRPFANPPALSWRANDAKLALLENIQARYGRAALPKAFDYCVAYRAGTEFPPGGMANLSLPPSPYETFAFGARFPLKRTRRSRDPTIASALGFTANFQRVEKQLAIECNGQEASVFRSDFGHEMKGYEEQLSRATGGQLPGYAPCAYRSALAYVSGQKLSSLLDLEFLHPQVASARQLRAGYHLGLECLTQPATAAAFRATVSAAVARGLAREGAPAAALGCVAEGLRAELTAPVIRELFAVPNSAFDHLAARITTLNQARALRTFFDEIRVAAAARTGILIRSAAQQCVGGERV